MTVTVCPSRAWHDVQEVVVEGSCFALASQEFLRGCYCPDAYLISKQEHRS